MEINGWDEIKQDLLSDMQLNKEYRALEDETNEIKEVIRTEIKMKTLTFEEWEKEGNELFGKDKLDWKFVCPACGHVSSINDFRRYTKDADDAVKNCIGRFNGKGVSGFNGKDNGDGCDWQHMDYLKH